MLSKCSKLAFCFLLICGCQLSLLGFQSVAEIDSLHKVVQGIDDLDSQRVFLNTLHERLLSTDDIQGLALTVSLLAENYYAKRELDKALEQFLVYIELTQSFEEQDFLDQWNIMVAFDNIGEILSDVGEHKSALMYYDSSALAVRKLLEVAKEKDDIEELRGYLESDEHKSFSSYSKVEELSLVRKRGLALIKKYENTGCGIRLNFMNALGLAEKTHGNLEASKEFFKAILSESCIEAYPEKQKIALHNLANVYLEQRDYKTALEYFDLAIAVAIKLEGDSAEELFVSYLDKGEVLFKLERFKEALEVWETTLNLGLDISNRPEYFLIYGFLKETHEILGNHAVADSYGELLTMFESNFRESKQAIKDRDQLAAIRLIIQNQESRSIKMNLLKDYVVYSAIGLLLLSLLVFYHFNRVKKKKKRVLFGKIGDILFEDSETERNDL